MKRLTNFAERYVPRLLMHARVAKNRRELFGLYGSPSLLTDLVPSAKLAVDVGAARGLYAEWICRKAGHVEAFEANPAVFDVLERSSSQNIVCHNVALSSKSGTATLNVPTTGLGEASLNLGASRGEVSGSYSVRTETLDSYSFRDVGFLKIDVEGHEEEVLQGAQETLARSQPTIFVEIEERHRPGALRRIRDHLCSEELGYSEPLFLFDGRLRSFSDFDQEFHQPGSILNPSNRRYVSNFVFIGRGGDIS